MIKPLVSQSIYLKLILEYFEHIEYWEYHEEHNQHADADYVLNYNGYYLLDNLIKIMYNDKNFIIKVLENFLKSPNHKHHKIFCYMCGNKEIDKTSFSQYYNIIFKSENNFLENTEIKFQIKNINEIIKKILNNYEFNISLNHLEYKFHNSVISFCILHYFLSNFDEEFSEFTTILENFKTEILYFLKYVIIYEFLDNNSEYLLEIIKKDCDVWEESFF
ncbi:hypothetical protein DMUE_5890 [Dictyocoela muelleri]|nr:hypothetical protein DMUE_5890 [Dictyocoela muelleri]